MRIIGYSDPRNLNELKEWNELKEYHHFCISQTLVQGLSREFGRTEFKVLTTIDKLIKKFYKEWTNNPENDINQFLDIRRKIEKIENKKLRKAFMENRMDVYNSIRFLLECDITSNQLKSDNLTKEKIELIRIYKEIEKSPNWAEVKELDNKTMYSFKEAVREIIIDELAMELDKKYEVKIVDTDFLDLDDESKIKYIDEVIKSLNRKIEKRVKNSKRLKERLEMYKEILDDYDSKSVKKVIFHGVHQFTPIMLKLIKYLENNNVEVIFLINYNDQFKRLYSTWDKVYEWTKCRIEKNFIEYKYDQLEIAKNYSAIIEGNFDKLTYDNNLVINRFDNYTEMGNYIAEKYIEARDKVKEFNASEVLGNMSEQFYSVDGSTINDMLQVYFPEQFAEKHFLAYPVGQLILAIYNLWDEEENKIKMKESIIRECLATNIWSRSDKEEQYSPLEIFEMIKIYFSDLEDKSIDEYLNRIRKLKNNIININKSKNEDKKIDYKRLGFYKLDIEKIEFFENVILEIRQIIKTLMGDGKKVNMIKHYKNLLFLISEKINVSKDESIRKEIKFVKEINERLNHIDCSNSESISAIKETLQFYLAQNRQEDSSNWIVRDFNQIDGGVLLADPKAKERSVKDKKSVYHFMEVSDKDMQGKTKVKLSWPLDKEFIEDSTDTINIINICKSEYKNYLRYILFYALFFIGNTEIKISYIENKVDNQKEELYYILKLLNLKEEPLTVLSNLNFKNKDNNQESKIIINENCIREKDIINYNFCEERFLYESLIEGEGTYNTDFLIKQYLKNFIAIRIYDGANLGDLQENIKLIAPYGNDAFINDLSYEIKNMIEYLKKNNSKENGWNLYKEIKKNYILAKFTESEESEVLTTYKKTKARVDEILNYLNGGAYKGKKNIQDKCTYCKYRQICIG